MRKNHLVMALIIIILVTISVARVSGTEAEDTPYHDLFQIEFSYFADIYSNVSIPGFDIYKQAEENGTLYPLNSYNLLLNCYRTVLLYNVSEQIELVGNESATETLLATVQNNLSIVTSTVENIVPRTLASLEWLDLAKREITDAGEFLNQSQQYYDENNYNVAIVYLVSSDSSIHKANGFATLANLRNMENATFVDTSELLFVVENVAPRWIDRVESIINFYNNSGYVEQLQYPKLILNESKEFYTNGLYYISIMNAAYAQALVDYYIYEDLFSVNYSQTISACRTYLNCSEITMDQIYSDPSIDAPFAESTIELAKLHLQDAENEETNTSAIALARLSIQESLIARQQALAVLDLKTAITEGVSEYTVPEDVVTEVDEQMVEYLLLIIIILETIGLFVLLSKRK